MWGADKTIRNLLPTLWSILGELMREVFRQTAGVSATTTRTSAGEAARVFADMARSLQPHDGLVSTSIYTSTHHESHRDVASTYSTSLLEALSPFVANNTNITSSSPSSSPSILKSLRLVFFLCTPSVLFNTPLHIENYQDLVDVATNSFTSHAKEQGSQLDEIVVSDELFILLVMLLSYSCSSILQYQPILASSTDARAHNRSAKSVSTGSTGSTNVSKDSENLSVKEKHYGIYITCIR
jgi:hypothetical protein